MRAASVSKAMAHQSRARPEQAQRLAAQAQQLGMVAMARDRAGRPRVGRDARRPVAEHDDAVGQEQRLLDIVGHQQRGEAARAATARTSSPCMVSRVRQSSLPSGSSSSSRRRIVDQRAGQRRALRHAARELVRIGVGEAARARPARSASSTRPRWLLQQAARLQAQRDVAARPCARDTASGPGTRRRATGRGR